MSTKFYILVAMIFFTGILASLFTLRSPVPEVLAENIGEAFITHPVSDDEPVTSARLEQTPDCNQNILTIMEQIAQVCEALGPNEVCYGNRNVDVLPRNTRSILEFDEPGDQLPLNQVRSLRLSTLDLENDFWGIAQMRLLLADLRNLQDVELLLFGDVYVEDTTQERPLIDVRVGSFSRVNLRNIPDLSGLVVTIIEPNQPLLAVARSVDGTWIQVEDPETGYQGWVYTDLVDVVDEGDSLAGLLIADASRPYWRPMQAFVFESGQTATCDNTLTDGMLIQTADGLTRITLLINEVTLELLPGANNRRATAFLQSNSTDGMNISMVEGRAEVSFGGATYEVAPDTSLQVSFDEQGQPSGIATSQTSALQTESVWLDSIIQAHNERLARPQTQIQQPAGTAGNAPVITAPQNPNTSGTSPQTTTGTTVNPPADTGGGSPASPPDGGDPALPPPDTGGGDPPLPPPDTGGGPEPLPPDDDNPAPPSNSGGGPPPHAGIPGPPPFAGTPGPPPHTGGPSNP